MIEGLSHITLVVKDVDRTARIFTEALGGREIYDSLGKNFSLSREKFFDIGGLWIVLMEGAALPVKSYNHIAFKIDASFLPRAEEKIRAMGFEIKPSRPRVEGEGQSLYFYDDDNHLFELHAGTLGERLARYGAG